MYIIPKHENTIVHTTTIPPFFTGPGMTAQNVTTHAYLEKIAIDTAKQLGEGQMKLPARGPKNFTEKVK